MLQQLYRLFFEAVGERTVTEKRNVGLNQPTFYFARTCIRYTVMDDPKVLLVAAIVLAVVEMFAYATSAFRVKRATRKFRNDRENYDIDWLRTTTSHYVSTISKNAIGFHFLVIIPSGTPGVLRLKTSTSRVTRAFLKKYVNESPVACEGCRVFLMLNATIMEIDGVVPGYGAITDTHTDVRVTNVTGGLKFALDEMKSPENVRFPVDDTEMPMHLAVVYVVPDR